MNSTIVKQLPDFINFRYGERLGKFHFIGQLKDHNQTGEQRLVYWDKELLQWIVKE